MVVPSLNEDILLQIAQEIAVTLPESFVGKLNPRCAQSSKYKASIKKLKALSRVSKQYNQVFSRFLWSNAYVRVLTRPATRKLLDHHADSLLGSKCRVVVFEHTGSNRSIKAQDILAVLEHCKKLEAVHITATCTSGFRSGLYKQVKASGHLDSVKLVSLTLSGFEERLSFVTNALNLFPSAQTVDLCFVGGLSADKQSKPAHLPRLQHLKMIGFDIVYGRAADREDLFYLLTRETIGKVEKATTDLPERLMGEFGSLNRPKMDSLTELVVYDGSNPFLALMPMELSEYSALTHLKKLDLRGVYAAVACIKDAFDLVPRSVQELKMASTVGHWTVHPINELVRSARAKSIERCTFEGVVSSVGDYFGIDKSQIQDMLDELLVVGGVDITLDFPLVADRDKLSDANLVLPGFNRARMSDIDLYDAMTGILTQKQVMKPSRQAVEKRAASKSRS